MFFLYNFNLYKFKFFEYFLFNNNIFFYNFFNFFLKKGNCLFLFGYNDFFQIGTTEKTSMSNNLFNNFKINPKNFKKIDFGWYHSLILINGKKFFYFYFLVLIFFIFNFKENGKDRIFSFGSNEYGQLKRILRSEKF
jgi:hypothetical protein